MSRSLALLAVLALAGCSSSPPTSNTPNTSNTTNTSNTSNTTATTTDVTTDVTTTDGAQPSAEHPCGTATQPPGAYDHVVWIWMENHSARQVLGRPDTPYETTLAARCGTAADYHNVGGPSLPNYIGATSGDTWGISDDAGPSSHRLTVDNLFRQVRTSGRRAMSMEEGMPAPCTLSSHGRYAVKHNPAAYYQGADDRAACNTDDVPLDVAADGQFQRMLADGSLPAFTFVTPDMCHDTHDCPVSTGDQWLAGFVPLILSSPVYRQGHTAVFLVWDEDAPMPFIAIAPTVRPGSVLADRVDHYALLRTTEEMLGITAFLGKAAAAPSMRAALHL